MNIPTFRIKRGDTTPSVISTLTDRDGNPVNLAGATVLFIMRAPNSDAPKVAAAATILDQTSLTGQVEFTWSGSQTDTAGSYQAEWQVTFPGGHPQTFPTEGYLAVEIDADLNGTTPPPTAYCSPSDLLLGDLELPSTLNLAAYIERASTDVDLYLGQRYVVPVINVGPLLKAATADLAAAYVLMAQAQGGEDNRVNAYALHLYNRAMGRLAPYMNDADGSPTLPGATLLATNRDKGGPVKIYQRDTTSPVEAFYDYVQTPPLFPPYPYRFRPAV